MSSDNVVKFDLGRRNRRQALKADQADAIHIFETFRQLLESDLLRRAHEASWQVLSDGLPRQSMGEPGGGNGGHGDPTLGAVMANEQMTRMVDDLRAELERARSASIHAFRLASSIAAQTVPPAEAETPGAGVCQSCDRFVVGTSKDRLRSGWCAACYMKWRRAGCPDRSEFNARNDDPADPGA
jgi:hypothetical protein